jgi:tRNA(Ile2) C34 agmatinyltransferase TiaS
MRKCDTCKMVYIQAPVPLVELTERLDKLNLEQLNEYFSKLVSRVDPECPECGSRMEWLG